MSFGGSAMKTPEHCKGCLYREGFSSGISHCAYSIITGKLRNCPPEECPYYMKKGKKRKHIKLGE
jgi:hypothetical protein